MFRISVYLCAFFLLAGCILPMNAQQAAVASTNVTVPPMVNYSGILTDANGKPLNGSLGVTFSLYKDSQGGAPLWMETQNVQADKAGHYTAALGSSKTQGLPPDIFASGEARWLAVQAQGQPEQPRVLLMSVPYALKALDAETIGGRPASSFMLAPAVAAGTSSTEPGPLTTITGGGTADFIPVFTGASTIGNSKIFQTVGGNVGISTTTPAAKLDVKGTQDVRDTLTLFPKTTHPVLSVHGTALAVDSTGHVTFVAGQAFPGTGTVTSVGSGAGLTGGPITGSGSLSIASGGVTNVMLAHSSLTVTANSPLTGGGAVSLGGSTSLGLTSSCASSQILKWNGSAWACAADNNSGGTVTSVGSGLGLTGGPITGSGTLAINTSVVPQLGAANVFGNTNSISINSSNPDLVVSNAGGGEGIVVATVSGDGVDVTGGPFGFRAQAATSDAVVAQGGFDAGYFLGGGGDGVFAEDDNDTTFTAGLVGFEFGATQETLGVWAFSSSSLGIGTYTEANVASSSGGTCCAGKHPLGSWSDTGAVSGIGALTTADNGWSIVSYNNSSDPTIWAQNYSTSGSVLHLAGPGGTCNFDVNGSYACTGTKSAVVPVDNGARKVALYAIEGSENWFEDAGSGQLSNGSAVVRLESTFAQTVDTDMDYHVFLTPNGDCKGLYVTQKSANSFEVRELGGGTSTIAFDYRIMAKRKGYENIRLADRTKEFSQPGPAGSEPGRKFVTPAPTELKTLHARSAGQVSRVIGKPVINKIK